MVKIHHNKYEIKTYKFYNLLIYINSIHHIKSFNAHSSKKRRINKVSKRQSRRV